MIVFRLCHADFADLTGAGGLYGSGRWHNIGQPVLYLGSSRALCVLERRVNEDLDDLPPLSMMEIEIPDQITIEEFESLPVNWRSIPPASTTQAMGSSWLSERSAAVISVPSVLIPEECNFVVNPQHPEANNIKIVSITEFKYDSRLIKF